MAETTRSGGCLCGAVRYHLRGEPLTAGLCHCADCRKVTGSAFLHYADWHLYQFSTTGEVRSYAGRSFCPQCGSHLFNKGDEKVEIHLGTLDDAPSDIRPLVEGWAKRRERWLPILAGTPMFPADP
ncbi:GFA family protein [Devosia chinhatensis]|uniref:Aldehyde-activating protein n=1 Tax=Devosia chinhatensis TaxID=429727 RepID=A0A0F5FIK3_9HYPH|nr:GFA family protein [Devosia chinhatensis]KKB08724.1 aldehyde-activating protein [Devosia chinhatensis]